MNSSVNEFGEKVVTMSMKERGPLTDKELNMLDEARKKGHVYDEDCPPIPDAMHEQIIKDMAVKR